MWIAALTAWVVLFCLPVIGFLDGPYIAFEVTTIRCGHQPAIATNFAAAYSYDMPGDLDYGPSIFSDTFYCSAAEAEAAGYHRTVLRGG
jgi:hypothetical protein